MFSTCHQVGKAGKAQDCGEYHLICCHQGALQVIRPVNVCVGRTLVCYSLAVHVAVVITCNRTVRSFGRTVLLPERLGALICIF